MSTLRFSMSSSRDSSALSNRHTVYSIWEKNIREEVYHLTRLHFLRTFHKNMYSLISCLFVCVEMFCLKKEKSEMRMSSLNNHVHQDRLPLWWICSRARYNVTSLNQPSATAKRNHNRVLLNVQYPTKKKTFPTACGV